jgi:hypothetical protein
VAWFSLGAALECGENRRLGIFFSSEAPPARKQNAKAAILAAERRDEAWLSHTAAE